MPRCPCGGAWKPDTISIGQSLVSEDLERAFAAAERANLLVAAGTSLLVGPINGMFDVARSAGARTAILTASETAYDGAADFRLDAPVETTLPALLRAAGPV